MMDTGERVSGECDPRFEAVKSEFKRNFTERGEIGAAVCVYLDGRKVVDLWGGQADRETGKTWQEDTMAVVFSSTKGLAAMCLHILIDRGIIEVDAPVCKYWPEFAANEKDAITVGMVMSHQAGLPVWQESLPEGALLDWDFSAARLAAEAPVWEPGEQHGYHAVTLGTLEGEIVRRATGMKIGQFLRKEIAEPFGADVWIGLPENEEHRVATAYMDEPNPNSPLFRKFMEEPGWIGAKMMTNSGNDMALEIINSRARHAAEIPAAGGIVTARGLARAYAPLSLDGSLDGQRMVRERMLPLMRTTRSASSCDTILRVPTTFTLGFSKTWGARSLGQGEHVILGEHAFGTPGMGGSIGFADGDARIAFSYIMNFHGPGVGLNDRGQSLVDAVYRAVGYTSSEPGFWVR
ncbi:serine hydrolase domain-containing protein [Henriciella pelagia]|jgi:CubicO group peptidase (beta-lactamase class C family)|uniref:Esterase n=1 Tax=Henriciella pelagia TaxID=1977912 RepID=A0ABQ1JI48_9PROT|nr:serine hydrolase domain-containing protein [Henriciella pelagia]GGB67360.1 esterase [Henriciella pelagia]